MSKVLKVQGLRKSYVSGYERLHILNGLDLELEEGVMLGIMGASGSGKSTFLHLVGGMEKPDSGEIIFDGRDVTRLNGPALADFRNREIGFVFQFHHLLPEFTALENAMFPLLLRGSSWKEAEKRARGFIAEIGLEQRMHHRPGELSGGEQQRVAIARALTGHPRLLLADEPTGNLDVHTSENVYGLLLQIHHRHRLTSIIVTHNERLASLCDCKKRMVEGKLL
jgi:lipoprotein-releasing system ATP-binding protein